jgi:hypothetical protein
MLDCPFFGNASRALNINISGGIPMVRSHMNLSYELCKQFNVGRRWTRHGNRLRCLRVYMLSRIAAKPRFSYAASQLVSQALDGGKGSPRLARRVLVEAVDIDATKNQPGISGISWEREYSPESNP